jgi:hypothetical protein
MLLLKSRELLNEAIVIIPFYWVSRLWPTSPAVPLEEAHEFKTRFIYLTKCLYRLTGRPTWLVDRCVWIALERPSY